MMTDGEINNLLNDFLSDNSTDGDEQFVQNVLLSLPPEPRFAWVKDFFPAVVLFFTMITIWKFKLLTPTVVMTLASDGLSYLQTQWQSVSAANGTTILAAVFCMVCYYAYETFVEI
ncbi:MAG: hypothetical protein IT287_05920 [Bdellovibrionaceae bacterium]|nr:hypothetical protein [Pseudobdellovibrionaceae bacterium]